MCDCKCNEEDEICLVDSISNHIPARKISFFELQGRLEKYKLGHDRYEKLRLLNPQQFALLYQRNLMGQNFDALVDALEGGDDELPTRPDGLAALPQSDAMQAIERAERNDEQ